MFKLASVATVVALSAILAGASGAVAQSTDQQHHAQSSETRDDRLNEVKQRLRLTPQQEPLWGPVAEAVRSLRETAARAEESEPGDAMERLRSRAERAASRAEALKRLADAAQPLWAALSDEQKRDLPRALRYAARIDDQERTIRRERDDDRDGRMMGRHGMMDRMHRDRMGDREERGRDGRYDRRWREDSDDDMRGRSDDRRMGRHHRRGDDWDRDPREGYGRHDYHGHHRHHGHHRGYDDDRDWHRRRDDDRRAGRGWDDDGRERRGYGRGRFCD